MCRYDVIFYPMCGCVYIRPDYHFICPRRLHPSLPCAGPVINLTRILGNCWRCVQRLIAEQRAEERAFDQQMRETAREVRIERDRRNKVGKGKGKTDRNSSHWGRNGKGSGRMRGR
jgi:hypothetical protein